MDKNWLFEQAINKASLNPKILFLIDGSGAILSALLLGVVLVQFEQVFGIPSSTLYLLASLPCLFAIYDWYCYREGDAYLGKRLKGIALMNVSYCCISVGLAFYHIQTITYSGRIYIALEVMIVIALAFIEYQVAGRLTSKKSIWRF